MSRDGTVLGEYSYDGQGRRVKKLASGMVTLYHYDYAGNLIRETDGNGGPLRDYVYLNGERIAMKVYGTQAGWYYFVNDHLGTPHKIVSASGGVVWAAAYLPFGGAQIVTETVANSFRFPGQYYDAETGLHYNWHRYYDPQTGRYLTPDPIGLDGGPNYYTYVANDSVNFSDFKGLYRSPRILRMLVPGQIAWDNAMTALENGNYFKAALNGTVMFAEQVMVVYTFGQGGQGSSLAHQSVEQCVFKSSGSVGKAVAPTVAELRALGKTTNLGREFNVHHILPEISGQNAGIRIQRYGQSSGYVCFSVCPYREGQHGGHPQTYFKISASDGQRTKSIL